MQDAKTSLSQLVKWAAAGEDILIARSGKPVAMLTRLPDRRCSTLLGAFKGKIHMAEDSTPFCRSLNRTCESADFARHQRRQNSRNRDHGHKQE
jgi:antitoxin (DNA-binding transcriptional repressor) of toxin-antitoxin stability system